MLDKNILSQLAQLKKDIHDSMDYAEGAVRGTSGKHGFVDLDDGRHAYLDPDTMQQLLPGDRIRVSCSKNDNKKWQAKLEKFISSDLKYCVGSYSIKGNNHFVAIDHPQLTRWLFVPPKFRKLGNKALQQNDLVLCRISQHPIGHGKGQVKVVKRLGTFDDVGIERQYIIAKHGLHQDWHNEQLEQTKEIVARNLTELDPSDELLANRQDLTQLPFVTIDAESTLDMDDALYIEKDGDHWILYVAIADPSAAIKANSPLDKEAQRRAASVYFPSYCLPMLPNELSQKYLSLLPNEKRLALVCKIKVDVNGGISEYEFFEALIQSKAKLSYQQVVAFLEENRPLFDENAAAIDQQPIIDSLQYLNLLTQARKAYRAQQQLVQNDKIDFYFKLNKQQKIESIELRQLTNAHQLVEEAMLSANICAGDFFEKNQSNALFTAHRGFRPERMNDVKKLLENEFSEFQFSDLSELHQFTDLFRQLIDKSSSEPVADKFTVLLSVLKRLLKPGETTCEPTPHFGLGLPQYAMVTSPIRRYSDLYNHRLIKQLLQSNSSATKADEHLIGKLQEQMNANRLAIRELEQWLICQYMADKKGQSFDATISAVSNQGLGVRLVDSGIDSFIQLRNSKEKPVKFNSQTMRMDFEGEHYHLEKPVTVLLKHIDMNNKQLLLSLAPNTNN